MSVSFFFIVRVYWRNKFSRCGYSKQFSGNCPMMVW